MDYYNIAPGVSGTVTLEDLKQSRSASAGLGKVSQTQFIDAITDTIIDSGEEWKVGNIFYKNNTGRNPGVEILDIERELPERQKEYAPIEKDNIQLQHPGLLLFKRLTGVIELPQYADDEQKANIAFSISQNGFEIAVGNEVQICSNMCIMNADHRVSSFGNNKMSPNDMIAELKKWMGDYKNIYEQNLEAIHRMKAFNISPDFANQIFGDLYRMSILSTKTKLKALNESKHVYLGTNMVGKGQATYLDEVVLKHREDTSIWDLYNDITYHMKPDQIDTVGMIQQNASLASYLTSVIN